MADAAHHLTNLLGQDHDLAVLQQVVAGELKNVCADTERALLAPLLGQRRSELKNEACELGDKIYAEQDDEFIHRMHRYWKAWS